VDTSDRIEYQCAALTHNEATFTPSEVNVLGNKIVKVYIEADKAIYDAKGGTSGAVNWISSLFESIKILYANESITTEISEIFVWNTQDSYSTSSSVTALNAFRSARPNANGDLKHLIALKPSGLGGVAWVNTLCTSYAYAYSNVQSVFKTFPAYSWTLMVFAHEMGHNLGSPHTQACKWGSSNNQALDNCSATEGNCAPGPTPTNGGTVMSYCHLSSVGINLSNGFGPEPGDLIRSKVAAAQCLTETNGCVGIALISSNPGLNSLTIGWVHTTGTYFIRYKEVNSSNWTEQATNQDNYQITGLLPSTTYTVQVRSDCEASYSTSINTRTLDPPTNCGSFVAKTFETNVGFTQLTTDDFDWVRKTGRTSSANTGPSSAYEGSTYLYTESSRPNYPSKLAIIESECFSLAANQGISFAYHMYGNTLGKLTVKLNGNTIWEKSGDQGNTWTVANIPLPNVSNAVLSFEALTGSGYRSDIAIDDVKIVTTSPELCSQNAGNSLLEWIESIKFGNIQFTSGNNGGLLDKDLDIILGSQQVTMAPGHLRTPCQNLFWAAYKDLNGEWVEVYSGESTAAVGTLMNLTEGKYRFILSYDPIIGPCTPITNGEIENYVLR
jgi:hypothetical protein